MLGDTCQALRGVLGPHAENKEESEGDFDLIDDLQSLEVEEICEEERKEKNGPGKEFYSTITK